MADIRINALATTAASTASDDFVAVDGSANGTRKLNAYSPTFGGNVVATGTLTVNSTTDSSSKDTGAIVTEGGLGVEKSATIGGNLTTNGVLTVVGNVANIQSSSGVENYLRLNQVGTTAWDIRNIATSGALYISNSGSNWVTIAKTTGATVFNGPVTAASTLAVSGNLTVNGGTATFQDPTNSYRVTLTTAAAKSVLATSFGGSSLALRTNGSATDALLIDSSLNTTLSGNLTVSGTGTSSFAGVVTATGNGTFGGNSLAGNRILTVSNTATAHGAWASMAVDTSVSGLKLAHLSSGWSGTFLTGGPTTTQSAIYTTSSAPIVFGVNSTYVGKAESTGWTLAGNLTVSGTGNNIFNSGGGNVLIGTTTDGGQKLQVNGTAYFAGAVTAAGSLLAGSLATFQSGLVVTNVTPISTASSGGLSLKLGLITSSPSSATDSLIAVNNTGGPGAVAGDLLYIPRSDVAAAHRWFGNTAGTIASRMVLTAAGDLTLTGAATFAGAVTVPSLSMSTDAQGSIINSSSNVLNIDAAAGDIRVRPKPGSAFIIGNSAALRLGSTYTAGAPTATGYVAIQDSLGNTYKVLVGT